MPTAGDRMVIDVGSVAHGGHCVARVDGQVVFVRHALPGERVEAVVTGVGGGERFLRADAVTVLSASPDRVASGCEFAGPNGCGGCDWQHVSLSGQRALKSAVVVEAMTRFGRIQDIAGVPLADAITVEPVAGDRDGFSWRTRLQFTVADDGRLGLRRHHSHDVVAVDRCAIAVDAINDSAVTARPWSGCESVEVVASSTGDVVVVPRTSGSRLAPETLLAGLPEDVHVAGVRGSRRVTEIAGDRHWQLDASDFWQVHPGLANALVDAVRAALAPRRGELLIDLYCGVGLFAGALARDLGTGTPLHAVEGDRRSCGDARLNLADVPQVVIHQSDVARWLQRPPVDRADLVVLDPSRSGAGSQVMTAIAALRPRVIAYVACDPVVLARDLGTARSLGYDLRSLRVFDAFPMTHHMECLAVLEPAASG